ncbi:MAG: hypothetical protein JWP69_200 [Flaviaesturariibacter sp.]|nr:hypothetical protein [Flaviaesturariibacter sp.]
MFDLREIARELEKQRCQTHRQTPKITVSEDKIIIAACCVLFQQKLEKQKEKAINDRLDDVWD